MRPALRGVILSGGKGTRLRPITHTGAKQLVPVANRPVLFYAIDALVGAGIEDIAVVVGDTAAEVMAAAGDGSAMGARLSYLRQEQPLGLAHAVACAREWLGDFPFVVFLGDNLLRDGIAPLVQRFRVSECDAMILLARVRDPQRFGVAELSEGRVTRLVEKPAVPGSDLALVGVYLFQPVIHEAIQRIRPSARGELEITDALQRMIDDGRNVEPHVIEGWWATGWKDTGNLEDMLEANRIVLEGLVPRIDGRVAEDCNLSGRVVVEAEARLRGCTVRGPAIIGHRAVLEDVYVGPFTSIGDGCVLRRAEIDHSIVLEGAHLEDTPGRLTSSLIGRGCVVTGTTRRPHAIKLLIGDDSMVELS